MKINWDINEPTLNEILKNIIYSKTLGLDDPKSFEGQVEAFLKKQANKPNDAKSRSSTALPVPVAVKAAVPPAGQEAPKQEAKQAEMSKSEKRKTVLNIFNKKPTKALPEGVTVKQGYLTKKVNQSKKLC